MLVIHDTAKLLALLRAFPPNEPTKKRFVTEMVQWSARAGEYPNGDPEIHHVAGSLYAEGNSFILAHKYRNMTLADMLFPLLGVEAEAYDAERHLTLGTKDSPETLALLEYDWYTQDESHTAALYCARCVFPYLLTSNLRSANKAFLIFTSRLSSSNKIAHGPRSLQHILGYASLSFPPLTQLPRPAPAGCAAR